MRTFDEIIDSLIADRKRAESLGMAQSETDTLFLLALLLEDAKRNPSGYINRP